MSKPANKHTDTPTRQARLRQPGDPDSVADPVQVEVGAKFQASSIEELQALLAKAQEAAGQKPVEVDASGQPVAPVLSGVQAAAGFYGDPNIASSFGIRAPAPLSPQTHNASGAIVHQVATPNDQVRTQIQPIVAGFGRTRPRGVA